MDRFETTVSLRYENEDIISSDSISVDEERDEVVEIQKLSSKDTHRVRVLRSVVTALLFITAMAVTLTTNALLRKQENTNFETAVREIVERCRICECWSCTL